MIREAYSLISSVYPLGTSAAPRCLCRRRNGSSVRQRCRMSTSPLRISFASGLRPRIRLRARLIPRSRKASSCSRRLVRSGRSNGMARATLHGLPAETASKTPRPESGRLGERLSVLCHYRQREQFDPFPVRLVSNMRSGSPLWIALGISRSISPVARIASSRAAFRSGRSVPSASRNVAPSSRWKKKRGIVVAPSEPSQRLQRRCWRAVPPRPK
jgi:hypothetical protein